jgi:hydrogenase expression/formation protein HypE
MYLANEGRFVLFVPASQSSQAIAVMNAHEPGNTAARIGTVTDEPAGVILKSLIGASRIVDMFTGEQLPRIC